jgi:putative ABC transport system permease protein
LSGSEIASLTQQNASETHANGKPVRIDLLAATAGGAPNVVSLDVAGVDPQPVKDLDDNYLAMNLRLAQRLVYGRDTPKVTGIVLQLHRSEDLPAARARLNALIAEHRYPLEVRDSGELNPFYVQVRQFFSSLFLFIAVIMATIALFAVANTMTMAVMERTSEIGTSRAMGVRRAGIMRQFLAGGAMLGAIGATVRIAAAFVTVLLVNASGLAHRGPERKS